MLIDNNYTPNNINPHSCICTFINCLFIHTLLFLIQLVLKIRTFAYQLTCTLPINMSLSDFFTPIDLKNIVPKNGYYTSQLGSKISYFSVDFPNLEPLPEIAIIGVQEDRNAVNNPGCALAPDYIREKLYQLNEGSYNTKIVDLGNIKRGETVTDTYIALKTVINELVKKNIIPVIR